MRKCEEAAAAFWSGKSYKRGNTEVVCPNSEITHLILYEKCIAELNHGDLWVDSCGFLTKTTVQHLNAVLDRTAHKVYLNGPELLIDDLVWDGKSISLDEIELFDAATIIDQVRLGSIVEIPHVMTTERFNASVKRNFECFRIVTHNLIRYAGHESSFQDTLFRNPMFFTDYVYALCKSQQLESIKRMYQIPRELNGNNICSVSINSTGTLQFECVDCTLSSQPTDSVNFPAVINVLLLASGEAFTLL